ARGDLKMAQNGKLKLELVDVFGKRLQEKVDIALRNTQLTHNPVLRSVDASKLINITDLFAGPHGIYQLTIDPPSYHPVNRFVNIKTSGTTEMTIPFPVNISKIASVTFPKFPSVVKELRTVLTNSPNVLSFENNTGQALYDALDDIRRAGVLNIARKTLATRLSNEQSVLSLVKEIRELRGDRFFAFVDKELREETKHGVNTGLFHSVPEILHHVPGQFEGFKHAGSFKTDDHFGNLQLTFFMKGDDCVADIDIDDAGGLGHIFQVLKNHFTGSPTHPYNIHEILVIHQHLDPGYRFNLK
ncbi:MAG: hypothetical protein LC754_19125, partial [Acidobacteria bacterium]|nr:hypothetical protein [Acidobacteriota bacterium]